MYDSSNASIVIIASNLQKKILVSSKIDIHEVIGNMGKTKKSLEKALLSQLIAMFGNFNCKFS